MSRGVVLSARPGPCVWNAGVAHLGYQALCQVSPAWALSQPYSGWLCHSVWDLGCHQHMCINPSDGATYWRSICNDEPLLCQHVDSGAIGFCTAALDCDATACLKPKAFYVCCKSELRTFSSLHHVKSICSETVDAGLHMHAFQPVWKRMLTNFWQMQRY